MKKLTGTRKVELGGGRHATSRHGGARPVHARAGCRALFLTLQRNVECWTTQPLLGRGERVSFPGSELVFQFYPGHGHADPVARARSASSTATGAAASATTPAPARCSTRSLPLATERAGGLAWEYLFPFDGQQPPWVSSLAQGTGLQAMARSRHAPAAPGRRLPDRRSAASASSRPRRPRACACPPAPAPTTCSTPGCRSCKIINGFIQSLVGLYDFAALTGDPTAQLALRRRRPRRRAPRSPTFDTGAWSLYSPRHRSRASPTSATTSSCATSSTRCASARPTVQYCSAEQHFTST